MHLKIVIYDDDEVVCSQIESMILRYEKEAVLDVTIQLFYDGSSLMDTIQNDDDNFDLVYLDIGMDGINGLDIGVAIRDKLRDHKMQIVYVSGTGQYDR